MKHAYSLIVLQVFALSLNLNSQTFYCGDTLKDLRDGQKYATVLIGRQCWMKQNLNVGSQISSSTYMTNNGILEKYYYNNDSVVNSMYGGLYQLDEAMNYNSDVHGICPYMWHLPSMSEFDTLIVRYGGDSLAGMALKDTANSWGPKPGNNLSGFSGLPGGYKDANTSSFYQKNYNALFWTSSPNNFLTLYGNANALFYTTYPSFGLSIRCICDSSFISSIKEAKVKISQANIYTELFPNPVYASSSILVNDGTKRNFIFEVHNLIGQLITKQISYNSEIKIENSEFFKGIYVYRIMENGLQVKAGRFVIN